MSLVEYYMILANAGSEDSYRIVRNASVDERRIELAEKNMREFVPYK